MALLQPWQSGNLRTHHRHPDHQPRLQHRGLHGLHHRRRRLISLQVHFADLLSRVLLLLHPQVVLQVLLLLLQQVALQ